MGQSMETCQVGASRTTVGHCEQAGVKLLWVKAQMENARGATQAQQVSAAAAPKWDRDGDGNMGSIREYLRAISVVGPERRMRQAFSWWRLGRRQRGEWRDHGSGKGKGKGEILRQRERAGKVLEKARITTAVLVVTRGPNANTWTWRWRQREKATTANAWGKGLYYAGANEEDETEDTTDHKEKEESERRVKEPLTMRGGLVR